MPGIRPLLKLSYALNWASGWGAPGFHAVNLLLHLLNVALLWRLTAHLPGAVTAPAEPTVRTARLLCTLLFALHPIQTESVTYVSGRSMTLMAAFGLAALLLWLEAPRLARPRSARAAAAALFLAAILTKEVAVVLPWTLLLFPAEGRGFRRRLLPLLGLTTLGLVLLFVGFDSQRLVTGASPRPLTANLISELNAVYYLLGQLAYPLALNVDPVLPELRTWSARSTIQAAGLAVLAVLAWRLRRRAPWAGFGIVWFALLLAPTHSLVPRLDLASERHLYLAGIGVYWPLAMLLGGLGGARRWPSRLTVLGLVAAGVTLTHLRNLDYRDEISLWRATVRHSPQNARAWNNLGYAYYLAQRPDEARAAYRRALHLNPAHAKARQNLRALDASHPAAVERARD